MQEKKCEENGIRRMSKKEKVMEVIFLLAVFVFFYIWAAKAPFNSSPDEEMRYRVSEYIINHGSLPDGRDPEIRNPNWGISYAFNPYITCIIAAIFGKVVSLFTDSFRALYMSMRLVNEIFGTLTAFVALRIGKRLFEKEKAWFFTVLVTFLPGAAFLHTYLNMDSVALLATGWIFYCWVRAIQEGWTGNVCVQLALAMSLCIHSYYNAYGFLLVSAMFFVGIMLKGTKDQWDFAQMWKKGMVMLGIVFLLCGWWFIRNGILYDGDILGMAVSSEYAQRYAIEELKPSNRATPQTLQMTVLQMFLWIPEGWNYNWLGTVAASFVGTFGFMKIFMPEFWTKAYLLVIGIGVLGNVFWWKKDFLVAKRKIGEERIKDADGEIILQKYRRDKVWNQENWMRICLLIATIIPCMLLIYYAYASDFQAQGRYIMPALFPIMYFIVRGYDKLLGKIIKKSWVKKWFYIIASLLWVLSCIMVYVLVYAPNY